MGSLSGSINERQHRENRKTPKQSGFIINDCKSRKPPYHHYDKNLELETLKRSSSKVCDQY